MAYFPSEQEPGIESLRSFSRIVVVILVGVFLFLLFNLFSMQILEKEKYYALSTRNLIHREKVKARRGMILDRKGKLIAGNRLGYNLYLVSGLTVTELRRGREPLKHLGIRWDPSKYRSNQENLVKRYLEYDKYLELTVNKEKYPYIYAKSIPLRDYYYGETFYHPLGYVSLISPEYLRSDQYKGYDENDYIGKFGLEKKYESILKGTDGLAIYLKDTYGQKSILSANALGSEELFRKLDSAQKPTIDGKDIYLTLDIELQQFIYNEVKDISASVIVMDTSTGDLLAYVSSPSVDPNIFLKGITSNLWEKISSDPRHPLLDKGLSNFNPASTFKPFTAFCALMDGSINEEKLKPCRGVIEFYNIEKHCWKEKGHGKESINDAIRDSCNIFFYQVGDLLGINKFKKYADEIGLSNLSGIDLIGEKAPVIPDLKYKLRNKIGDGVWYPPETLDVAIGQGFVLLAPVKVVQLYGFFGSSGLLVTPHLLGRIGEEAVYFPQTRTVSDTEVFLPVRRGLDDVVDWGGTGWRAYSRKVDISGKTGTMQTKKITKYFQKLSPDQNELLYEERDNPWFASYAPSESPRYSAVVLMEHQGSGGYLPALLSKKIWEYMFEKGYLTDEN